MINVDNSEWYFQVGYVELLYAAMVIGILVALHFFRRVNRKSGRAPGLTAHMIEEHGALLGLLALAVVLFVINRVLGDLW